MSKERKQGWAFVRDVPHIPRLLPARCFEPKSELPCPVGNSGASRPVSLKHCGQVTPSWKFCRWPTRPVAGGTRYEGMTSEVHVAFFIDHLV